MNRVVSRTLIALLAACGCAGCSFSPDVAGSKIDCSNGKPCPEGWVCPETGDKICVHVESTGDSGSGGTGDGGGKTDGGGADGGRRDTGGACQDRCPSDKAVACVTDTSYHVCGVGADGCLAWGAERHCTGKCIDDQCEGCKVDCTSKDCGDDGCSGSCGSCARPPADTCKDNRTLSEYGPDGTCNGNLCEYTPQDTDCPYGCGNGKCTSCTPSCAGKECGDDGCGADCSPCDKPPASSCLNGTTLRHYDLSGACQNNKCNYTYTDVACANGCAGAQCKNCTPSCAGRQCGSDGCGGDCGACGAYAVCGAQGQCQCADANRLDCNGTWNDGCETDRNNDRFNCGNCKNVCTLANATVVGCVAGSCKVVTCAQDYGNCDGRDDNGCEANLPTDPNNCAQCGKKCNTAPAAACLADNKTLRTYDAQGTCAGSACSYTPHDTVCPTGCSGAQCQACSPSCAGRQCGDNGCGGSCGSCGAPPADTCVNANTLRKFENPGTCSGTFTCTYNYTDTNCPNGCSGAQCQACSPSCAGKQCGDNGCGGSCGGCTSPPADACISGKTLRQYTSPGTCNAGFTCDYPFRDSDCLNDCAGNTCAGCSCLGKVCGQDDGCGGTCGDP